MSIAYDATVMSPARARTSRDAILVAAREVLETDGLDAVTMQAVAERVGVRAPSLYKHVADRAALLQAVTDAVMAELVASLAIPRPSPDPRTDLRRVARRYRSFVRANPAGYGLLFARPGTAGSIDEVALADLGRPIVAAAARLAGERDALANARTIVSWAHGFVSMELAGAFRLGGDLDAAYAAGIEVILAGISGRANPPAG
jgi:AcrR family transcriptional regulator